MVGFSDGNVKWIREMDPDFLFIDDWLIINCRKPHAIRIWKNIYVRLSGRAAHHWASPGAATTRHRACAVTWAHPISTRQKVN